MKAVVMAGGKGTRLAGLKGLMNKHALPVYDKPMIEHVVWTLVRGGVDRILVLLDLRYPETIMEILEDGSRFGPACKIYYGYVREVLSPGKDLRLAEDWVGDERFVLMLGDSLFLEPLDFRVAAPHMFTMPLDGLDDPSKYGQVKVKDIEVIDMREKPDKMFSNLIQTDCWVFNPDFFEIARCLSEKTNGEVHIGMIAEEYVRRRLMLHTYLPAGSFIDLGTPEALIKGANMVREKRLKETQSLKLSSG